MFTEMGRLIHMWAALVPELGSGQPKGREGAVHEHLSLFLDHACNVTSCLMLLLDCEPK